MQTIYLVTAGSYSDYGIHAIFSNKEDATRYSEEFNKAGIGYDQSDIEEWIMDDPKNNESVTKKVWIVSVYKDGGKIGDPYETKILANKNEKSIVYEHTVCFCIHSFVSAEHAQKLAAEKYQQYLREHSIGLS